MSKDELIEALDGRLTQVAEGTWSAAQFIDFVASLVTSERRPREEGDDTSDDSE